MTRDEPSWMQFEKIFVSLLEIHRLPHDDTIRVVVRLDQHGSGGWLPSAGPLLSGTEAPKSQRSCSTMLGNDLPLRDLC